MNLKTETEIAQEVAARIRALRVAQKMTQSEISQRSGVALGTYRRFEQTGNIDFVRLIKIALILYRESDFDAIFQQSAERSLDAIEKRAQAAQSPQRVYKSKKS